MADMGFLRALISVLRGRGDQDAYQDYCDRLLRWAEDERGLAPAEYRQHFHGRYPDGTGRDLFLDYLLSVSKESPSYLTDHPGLLADRKKLFDRFGLPILTMRELRDKENQRLQRMESPLRV